MPSHDNLMKMVVSQMMKGPITGRIKATKRQTAAFTRRHEGKIQWVLEQLPAHKRASAAVPAVVCKALIMYGIEKTKQFCKALTSMQFTGADDPAHRLWMFLLRSSARDEQTITIYQKTVCAVRAYMDGRKLTTLTPIKSDLFEWDEDFTLPDNLVAKNEEVEAAIAQERAQETPPAESAIV